MDFSTVTAVPDILVSTPSEFDVPLGPEDVQLVADFDQAWLDFLQKYPNLIPKGEKTAQIKAMRDGVAEAKTQKEAVEKELKSQLELLNSAFEKVEESETKEMEEAITHQKLLREHLQRSLNQINDTAEIMSETEPWERFCHSLEQASAEEESKLSKASKLVKPSARAFHLIEPSENAIHDDFRAYQVDHALLKTQVAMLKKELEQYKQMTETSQVVGQFLTENNIWSIMTKPTDV